MDEQFFENIYAILQEIPKGYVTTYGDLAKFSGREKNARLVGKALHMAGLYGDFPCHRVLNSQGRCAPDFPEQADRLKEEGIHFKNNGCVDLKRHRWKGNE